MKCRWYTLLGFSTCSLLACGAHSAELLSADSEWGLGDWGGARTQLRDKGYDFMVGYVGEAAGNIAGGYNRDKTARYTAQWALGTQVDLDKVLGWKDADFVFTITERNGNSLSQERISDPRTGQLSLVQEVWGRGQTWRLTRMWYRQKYIEGALELKVGRFAQYEDFDAFPCNFQSLSFCGAPIGNYAFDILYSWPISQWAARLRYNFKEDWYTQIGVFEQNPSLLENHNGFKLSTSGSKGVVLPVELVWTPRVGQRALPGSYRVGYYYSSASANDVYEDVEGQPQALTGRPFKKRGSKHGWWFGAQQQVTAHDGDATRGLSVFVNATWHDQATSRIDNYQSIGVVYTGLLDARPKDDIGLAVSRIHINDDVARYEKELNGASGIGDYDDPGFVPVQHTENNVELNYGLHVANWLTVRPNIQFVRQPGGVKEVDDAWVAGLKIQASF